MTDETSNLRNADGSVFITYSTSSGNGASASIPYIIGDPSSTILWPSGSIGNPYTICSITRYATGTNGRVLQSQTDNWLHGHHGLTGNVKRGVLYNGAWRTNQVNTGTTTDWLYFCATSGNTYPNNVLLEGLG